ncbi:MAG: glycine cleavage system aminomethyltransferase GcvT [Candidatus Omnitrophota bacterium]
MPLKNTPLYNEHIRLGARMVDFSGWNMPVQYSGIIEEHLHTRTKAGLFDICHMGEFILKGNTANQDINNLLTCRSHDMDAGRCRYGFMLNNEGKILDDLIIYRTTEDEFMLVVNAACIQKDKEWIQSNLSSATKFTDISDEIAKIDLQGPLSAKVLSAFTEAKLETIKKYHFVTAKVCKIETIISRTGYTGELGYELYLLKENAVNLWRALLKNPDVKPAGLGARDTLRLEMGYSLFGQDIDLDHTPLEANLEKFIYFDKAFIGKDALLKQKSDGVKNILVGFIAEGRQSPRHNFNVICSNKTIGKVTSASFSPCLKKAIGLCYMEKEFAVEGGAITLSDNKVTINATITMPPFYKK